MKLKRLKRILAQKDLSGGARLSDLRRHMSARYATIAGLYQSAKITPEDLAAFIQSDPNYWAVADRIKQERQEAEHTQRYNATVAGNKTLIEPLLKEAEDRLLLLREEHALVSQRHEKNPLQLRNKEQTLSRLSRRIEDAEKTIAYMQNFMEANKPPKRPVGRPKKKMDAPQPAAGPDTEKKAAEVKKDAQ